MYVERLELHDELATEKIQLLLACRGTIASLATCARIATVEARGLGAGMRT